MGMITKNQKGFGAVEAVLVLVIVGIIGSAGWYIVSINKNIDKSNASTTESSITKPNNKTSKTKDVSSLDITVDWLRYESPDGKYSIKLPDGWKLVSYHNGSNPYTRSSDDIVYKFGQHASVESTEFAGDVLQVAFAMGESWRADIKGEKKVSFKTEQGLEVDRYDYFVPKEEIQEISAGTKEYLYVVKGGKINFQVLHDVSAGTKDSNDLIKQAINTLVLKS